MNLINLQELEEIYVEDQAFQKEIVSSFIKGIPAYLDCLRSSLTQKNTEDLLIYTCQLRAVSVCCCIHELDRLCSLLEEQVQLKEFVAANQTLQEIKEMLCLVQDEYQLQITYY